MGARLGNFPQENLAEFHNNKNAIHESIQLMLALLKSTFLGLRFFYYTLLVFLLTLSVIPPYMVMILLSTVRWDLWEHLEWASELASDLRETKDCDMKWLVDFHAGKFQLVLFYHLKCCSAIDVEIDGSVWVKSYLLSWNCFSLFNFWFNWKSYIIFIPKLPHCSFDFSFLSFFLFHRKSLNFFACKMF